MSSEDQDFPVVVHGFTSISDGASGDKPDLHWYCAPDCWESDLVEGKREGRDGSWTVNDNGELVVKPPAKKDFWRKTYYEPVMVKDDAPCLFATVPRNEPIMAETCFTVSGDTRQFDQAGICVRLDSEHWLKTGIEIVDGIPRMSCVCCNVYSDWSTQKFWKATATRVRIRVHLLPNNSIVVEAWDDDSNAWSFIRICHLNADTKCDPDPLEHHENVTKAWVGEGAPKGRVFIGVLACCPEEQAGTTVTFHDFTIVAGSTFKHDSGGVFE